MKNYRDCLSWLRDVLKNPAANKPQVLLMMGDVFRIRGRHQACMHALKRCIRECMGAAPEGQRFGDSDGYLSPIDGSKTRAERGKRLRAEKLAAKAKRGDKMA